MFDHFFFKFRYKDTIVYSVRVGSSYKNSGGSIVKLKKIIRHDFHDYFPNDYDFALLELVEPLKFTDIIQPIALPNKHTVVKDDIPSLVTGWGKAKSI